MITIGISGGSGSGKSTIVRHLTKVFSEDEISIISQDSYYNCTDNLSSEERKNINFDHPASIDFNLLIEHLKLLKKGETIQQPTYSYTAQNRLQKTIPTKPKKIILVEGILIFSNKTLFDFFDFTFFIDVDRDERKKRIVKRDIIERGRTIDEVENRFDMVVDPMHHLFVEPVKEICNFVISNNEASKNTSTFIEKIIKKKI